jgi:hypothetical protein
MNGGTLRPHSSFLWNGRSQGNLPLPPVAPLPSIACRANCSRNALHGFFRGCVCVWHWQAPLNVSIMYQGPVYKQARVRRTWIRRHFVLLSDGRLLQAPGPLSLPPINSPERRRRARAGSLDSDASPRAPSTPPPPLVATVTAATGGGVGCSCAGGAPLTFPLPDGDYDPAVKFKITADSFIGVVNDGDPPELKLSNERVRGMAWVQL